MDAIKLIKKAFMTIVLLLNYSKENFKFHVKYDRQ